jgi:hypothetical protein
LNTQPLKLARHTLDYQKGYAAPYPKDLHRAILRWYQNTNKGANWVKRIEAARQDFSTVRTWGDIYYPDTKVLLTCGKYPDKTRRRLSRSFMAWGLIYPDYVLCAYPVVPLGNVVDLTGQKKPYNFNPYYLRPSEWWKLPQAVYDNFTIRCGERETPVRHNHSRITQFEKERRKYIEYFCKQAKISVKFFDSLESKPTQMTIIKTE